MCGPRDRLLTPILTLQFGPILIKKLRKLINYQFSTPCFWWNSTHKPQLSRLFICSQVPKFGKKLCEKQLSDPRARGYLLYKGVTRMSGGKYPPPFHATSTAPQDPLFSIFQYYMAHFNLQLVLGSKISSTSSMLSKNQFRKPSNLAPIRSTSPHFRVFGPHSSYKMKVEYPPGCKQLIRLS